MSLKDSVNKNQYDYLNKKNINWYSTYIFNFQNTKIIMISNYHNYYKIYKCQKSSNSLLVIRQIKISLLINILTHIYITEIKLKNLHLILDNLKLKIIKKLHRVKSYNNYSQLKISSS